MGGEETEEEKSQPEQSGGPFPIVMDGKNKKHKSNARKKIAEYSCAIWIWLKKFGEPLTVVTLLLFGATVALFIATHDLVFDAKETAKRQLRAYVMYSDNVIRLLSGGEAYRISMRIKNSGQTTAYGVTYWWDAEIIDANRAPHLVRQKYIPETGEASSDIDPGGEWPIELQPDRPVSKAELIGLRDGSKAIYAWGIIKYQDVFRRCQYANFLVRNGRETTEGIWHFDVIQINNDTSKCVGGDQDHIQKAEYNN
jgi:hypothetical protein